MKTGSNRGSIPLWTTKLLRRYTLLQAYEVHISLLERLSGIDYAYNTVRRYKSSLNSLKRFLNGTDIKLSRLSHEFVSDYYLYLLTTEHLQANSAYKNIKALYRVIHVSIEKGWLQDNPFRNFKCKYKQPVRPYLTDTEINAVLGANLKSEGILRCRDVFIFQIYTGLSYADVVNVTQNNIQTGVDGKDWLVFYRQKTGTRTALPLLPKAKEVLIRYKYRLPVINNQKMNEHLKEIANICCINKNLTTHVARHTFATTITLCKGVPIETVSKVLGHTDIKTTQIYAKVVDTKISDDFKLLVA